MMILMTVDGETIPHVVGNFSKKVLQACISRMNLAIEEGATASIDLWLTLDEYREFTGYSGAMCGISVFVDGDKVL